MEKEEEKKKKKKEKKFKKAEWEMGSCATWTSEMACVFTCILVL